MARESRYPLRLPSELHDLIKTEADKLGVSVNELIVRALSAYFEFSHQFEARFDEMEKLRKDYSLLLDRLDRQDVAIVELREMVKSRTPSP